MEQDFFTILQSEFCAEDGSFLLQLRCDMVWDPVAFTRLTQAMLACCRAYALDDPNPTLMEPAREKLLVPRWLAEGFWYVSFFVRDHTSHPAWSERTSRHPDYYERAYKRLEALAEWFFTGRCPYSNVESAFGPM